MKNRKQGLQDQLDKDRAELLRLEELREYDEECLDADGRPIPELVEKRRLERLRRTVSKVRALADKHGIKHQL